MPREWRLAILQSMETLALLRVELEPADVGQADANTPAQAAANAHDWVVTKPSMAGSELIIIECRACGEMRSFCATPTTDARPAVDLEVACQADRSAERRTGRALVAVEPLPRP
jgi:hypothetical protein